MTCLLAAPAPGQQREAEQREEIVVVGTRNMFVAAPDRTIVADDVSTYGLATIGELIDELAREEGDSGGGAAIFVDGRRVSGLRSIEDYPMETVERIEILPPGSAGRAGGSPTDRAYNVVLRPRSRVLAARASVRGATDGGWISGAGELGGTLIERPRRMNVTARVRGESLLLESERDIVQPAGSPARLARSRSLRPARDQAEISFAAADQLAPWLHGSLNMKLDKGIDRSRLGLSIAGNPLDQRGQASGGSAELQLEAERGRWLFTLDAGYREDRRRAVTDAADDDPVRQRTRSITRDRSLELLANGPLLALPAGSARLTLGTMWNRNSIDGTASGVPTGLSQTMREVRVALDLPIASKAAGFAAPLGELSVGADLRRGRVSGLGAISIDTLTMRWEPASWLRIVGTLSASRTPPGLDLLAAPSISTPGVRYFDPSRAETVDVVAITGGNPALGKLRSDSRQLSLRIKPFASLDLVLNGEYLATERRNVVAALPPAGSAVLAAFPDRFTRDSGGRLIGVDNRPVNLDRQSEDQLRYGVDLSVPLRAGTAGSRGARLQLTAFHTVLLNSELVIRDGSAPIDLLSRRSAGLGGAARPRHQFEIALGYSERGLGFRLTADRRSASYLDLSSGASIDVLTFKPLTTLGLRAFAEGSRLLPNAKWMKGARVSLTMVNLTNDRETVRNGAGQTPLSYQPGYRDPLGRTIEIEFRKAF